MSVGRAFHFSLSACTTLPSNKRSSGLTLEACDAFPQQYSGQIPAADALVGSSDCVWKQFALARLFDTLNCNEQSVIYANSKQSYTECLWRYLASTPDNQPCPLLKHHSPQWTWPMANHPFISCFHHWWSSLCPSWNKNVYHDSIRCRTVEAEVVVHGDLWIKVLPLLEEGTTTVLGVGLYCQVAQVTSDDLWI